MCEKNIRNDDDKILFSYKWNGRTFFLAKEQAEQIYFQYGRYKYAEDLKDTIQSVFEDDAVLNKLSAGDLLPYAEILEDLLRENSDDDQDIIYNDCCEDVIQHYVIPKLEQEGRYGQEKKED